MTDPRRPTDAAITQMLQHRARSAPPIDLEARIMASVRAGGTRAQPGRRWRPRAGPRGSAVLVFVGLLLAGTIAAWVASRPDAPDLGPVVIELVPGEGARFGDWLTVASGSSDTESIATWRPFRDLRAVGDVLVAHSALYTPDVGNRSGVSHLLVSSDGLAWRSVDLPGGDVTVSDLAVGAEGALASGFERIGEETAGRLWSSRDGLTWGAVPAPPDGGAGWIISADEPRAIQNEDGVWRSSHGGPWEMVPGVSGAQLAHGPSGFIADEGGWSEDPSPRRVRFSPDLVTWTESILPDPLVRGEPSEAPMSVAAVGDGWVLIPPLEVMPDSLLVSFDGVTWDPVPRPAGLDGAAVPWISHIGDDVVVFELGSSTSTSPLHRVWRWRLGGQAPQPDAMPWIALTEPVAWRGGHVAMAQTDGDGEIVQLRFEPEPVPSQHIP